jgi:hypothetical protein
MGRKTRFKVLLYPVATPSAVTTNTFDSKEKADEYAKSYITGWHREIIEVDMDGRPTQARTVPLTTQGAPGGIERYVCTHCNFECDLADVAHDCTKRGRDDSFSLEPKEKAPGRLSAAPTWRAGPPKECIVDWVAVDTSEKWRAFLGEAELRQLRATGMWHREINTLQSLGILGSVSFEMDAPTLHKFMFRHLRKV